MRRAGRASVAANCPCSRGVAEQASQPFVPAPLCGRADPLGLVASATGSYEVARGRRAPARSWSDVVDLGRLSAAVPAGPVVAMQHGAAQHRVDAPLRGIPRSRIPVQEWIGKIGNHSLSCRSPQSALGPETSQRTKVSVPVQILTCSSAPRSPRPRPPAPPR